MELTNDQLLRIEALKESVKTGEQDPIKVAGNAEHFYKFLAGKN